MTGSGNHEADLQRGLDLAYRHLGRADRTVAQVLRHLEGREVPAEIVAEVTAALIEQGHLDDARYARCFTEDRRNLDGWGSRRIEQRLLGDGVAPELVAAAVTRPHEAEFEAAIAVLRRRMPTEAGSAAARERDRALGLLVRRGYDFELACDAVRAHTRAARAA